jgi:serine phosphatase RsbU (regulator of sigma subunit)
VAPDVTPDRLLALVNGVLTENIRQLGENKYMTICAFRRDHEGNVSFAGAHQDVVIYRAATDRVETIETSGLWLGIKSDIQDTLRTRQFTLTAGDLLVLFTDGVTEGARAGKLFDIQGVCDVVADARTKTAQEVLDDLFTKLQGYEVKDDATAIVIRQLERSEARSYAS